MILEVKDVVKRYDELAALDHFSFNVEENEIVGLLGPNGSGKSTIINCILGLLKYDSGNIKVFGEKMSLNKRDLKRNIGVVMQEVGVLYDLTVYENLDYFCGLYISDKVTRKKYVEEAIEFVGLEDFKKFSPKKLSGGLLRRLNIACGIVHKPKLIFFDEPTVAVDPQSRNNILEGIEKLKEKGATIVYTSHYMEEVEQLCDRVVIMDHGKTLATGTTIELKKMVKASEKIYVEILDLDNIDTDELRKLENIISAEIEGNSLTLECKNSSNNIIEVISYFNKNNIIYKNLYLKQPTLNDVFLEITGKELRD